MLTLKTEKKLSAISTGGTSREVKEINCHYCGRKIRFLISMPRICPGCMTIAKLTTNLFNTIHNRFSFYLGVPK